MADKNKIGHWLYQNKDRFDATFAELTWPTKYLPGYFDFSVTLTVEGQIFEGRGISQDRHLALEKASAEAIERAVELQIRQKFLSFAVAGKNGSQDHAYFEACERYSLRYHILHRVPLSKVSFNSSINSNFDQTLDKYGAKVRFYKMGWPDLAGVTAHVISEENENFFGFAAGKNVESCLSRSFLEAISNFAWAKDQKHNGREMSLPKSAWHLSPEFQSRILGLFEESSQGDFFVPKPSLKLERISLDSNSSFHGAPIDPVGYLLESPHEVEKCPW